MTDNDQQPASLFSLEKLYIKDISFEAPNVPAVFLQEVQPEIDIRLDISHRKLDDGDLFEVVMPVQVTARIGEKTMFHVEVQQAGLFQIQGVPDENMLPVLEISCPGILLPYAREAVSSIVGKGGFPPLLINPVNFEALFQQRHGGVGE